jgi:hypothetical protein
MVFKTPLKWPQGTPRTDTRKDALFSKKRPGDFGYNSLTVPQALDRLAAGERRARRSPEVDRGALMFPQTQTAAKPPPPAAAPIKRGPLSDDEKDRVAHLFETMKNPTASAIARKMNRLKTTIGWHMTSYGMRKKPLQVRTNNPTYYTAEQDEYIEALRTEGKVYREIAALASPPLWVCSIVGEERLPAPADDPDATAQCARCPNAVIYRASAPAKAEKICHRCFTAIGGKMAD